MKRSRRMARMARNKRAVPKLNLTSLMDVFTILVFFLLVNSTNTEVLQQPKQITLPDSVVEAKPRETVVIFVGTEEVLVQGKVVARVPDIEAFAGERIEPISVRLAELAGNVIGISTRTVADSQEVTVLADKAVPFNVIRKIMATCTGEGYTKVSLAVMQKAAQTTS
ncbi:MAG TPA: biopolymer transporter ExbD [Steroidobacteraceae bacterium]|jgi:biopolymer transport protein ExbD|nr:biopolymer transporter ExbD [Steroidobacteraceae bacterium]